ncbi:hypothetical protein GCM10025778_14950 [Paeniglutamicibacter antarcticus]|uniref:Uncharacterized protein n=1 Tax=Paeniglutamicibacter antarcticus TaxID=494023 RepID=A0ABP9TML3_9MICC
MGVLHARSTPMPKHCNRTRSSVIGSVTLFGDLSHRGTTTAVVGLAIEVAILCGVGVGVPKRNL